MPRSDSQDKAFHLLMLYGSYCGVTAKALQNVRKGSGELPFLWVITI